MNDLSIVILAAGKGTRMKSRLPKVLHPLAGKPLLKHVIDTARSLQPSSIFVVTGHESAKVRALFAPLTDIKWVEQTEQKGTGHAVQQVLPFLDAKNTLILYGDVPLTKTATLKRLVSSKAHAICAILTMIKSDPTGYGRIVRDTRTNKPHAIVEQKDASPEQLMLTEVNTGLMVVATDKLRDSLQRLSPENAQGELYLTDVVEILVHQGDMVEACLLDDSNEAEGVNSRTQLEYLERVYQEQQASLLMESGTTLADSKRIDIRGTVHSGMDNFIDINCVFEGRVSIGDNVSIGPNCFLRDCIVGSGTRLLANTIIEEATIGESCEIGPFARVRPGTVVESQGKLGNFVEVKKSRIGRGSKVNHLSYIGDCEMGASVNIGAGTITCNYDGANKHKTIIHDGVFVGSNTALVAPIEIGEDATIGAGSTLSSNVRADALTYSRAPAKTSTAWKRPTKESS